MVIKGKSRAAAGQLGKYLLAQGKNERVELKEINGTMSQELGEALKEMESIAKASQCDKFLYHASINPKKDEQLSPEQWQKAVDLLEKNIGLEGHQRAVVEHERDGRTHYHIVWNRVDVENLHAVKMSHNYRAHEETARELERQYGLERVQGAHAEREGQDRPERQPEQWAIEAGKRTGLSPHEVKAEVSKLWEQSDSGKAFSAALAEHGYILAHGDRKDFVLLDPAGVVHGIARRTGASAAEVRAKLADLSPNELFTVAEARDLQKGLFADHQKHQAEEKERQERQEKERAETERKEREAQLGATLYDRPDMVSTQRDAMRHVKDAANVRQAQQEKQRKEQEEREKAAKEIAARKKQEADEKPKCQQEAKREEKKDRTEQNAEARARERKRVLREIFEMNSPGSGDRDLERYERDRGR